MVKKMSLKGLFLLLALVGCTKPNYFIACSKTDGSLFVQQVSDSMLGIKLATALTDAGLYNRCAAFIVQ
jgi:hypothetical protein